MNDGVKQAFATARVIHGDASPVFYVWSVKLVEDEFGGHTKFELKKLPFDENGLSACLNKGLSHARHLQRVAWSDWLCVREPKQRRFYAVLAGRLEVELPNCFERADPITRNFGPNQRNGLVFSLDYELPTGASPERVAHRTRTPDGSALVLEIAPFDT